MMIMDLFTSLSMMLKHNILDKFFSNTNNLLLGLLEVYFVVDAQLLGVDQFSLFNNNK